MKTLTPKVDFKKVDKNIEATEALVDVLHKEKTKKTPSQGVFFLFSIL